MKRNVLSKYDELIEELKNSEIEELGKFEYRNGYGGLYKFGKKIILRCIDDNGVIYEEVFENFDKLAVKLAKVHFLDWGLC